MRISSAIASAAVVVATAAVDVGCAHTPDAPEVVVVDVVPSVGGRPITERVDTAASDVDVGGAVANVSWRSPFQPGGQVIFYPDRTVCVRREGGLGRRVGIKTNTGNAALDEVGISMIRIDVAAADEEALDGQRDVGTPLWIIIKDTYRAGAVKYGDDVVAALKAAGIAPPFRVVPLAGTQREVRFVRAADATPITDQLHLVVQGPAVDEATLTTVLAPVLNGPATPQRDGMNDTEVEAWHAGRSAQWPASFKDSDTEVKARFQQIVDAVGNGCRFQ